jgi:membrane carboxypeptidase/penicillin-binding protein
MVHKSQSQSLDKVVVDLNKAFADGELGYIIGSIHTYIITPGQAYMALLQDRSKIAWKSGTSNRQK